ncbi:hypothetical protein A0O34_08660 [Chryseobacterium glaciei]|uniref:Tetratricopeptide repeat protein n=2 Tax=Chryseobacterium glaciei TaxID=1685010 RepID=A0A172XUD4_9FLAO|nr:hypothetical protein A0O34_08660 [Chryseobacterium glaciei]
MIVLLQFIYCKKTEPQKVLNSNNKEISIQNISQKNITDTIHGYFNNDNIIDYIEINTKPSEEKELSIYLGSYQNQFKKIKSITITNDDFSEVENPIENFFVSNGKVGEIIIGSSCCGNFKTTETYNYKYLNNNWFLYKTLVSTVDDDFIPIINLNLNDLSESINGEKSANNKLVYSKEIEDSKSQNLNLFNEKLNLFKKNYLNKTIKNINGIDLDSITELLYFFPLQENNLNNYNDLAFYNMYTKDGSIGSIFLLKEIVNKFPDRIVSYINLGDAYWEFDNQQKAREAYQKYIDLMKIQNKDLNKIPKRVYERSK